MLRKPTRAHKREATVIFNPEVTNSSTAPAIALSRKKRVAAYARVSTEQDAQQNSYEAQIEFYTNFIRNEPDWDFVGIYADEGITGTSMKHREEFNRMVDDAMHGKIDLILTKSVSRFSRNTVDALTVTRNLRNAGVEVRFEKENLSSMDPNAEMVFTFMCSIAQEESRSISENVRWGKQRSMEQSKITLPYGSFLGYEKGEDGLPKIVEEEAKTVRLIYKWYLDGMTFSAIADELTARGIETPKHKKRWSISTVRSILTNEKYKGDAKLQKTYVVDFLTKKTRVNNGERKQWYIRDSHDAIISPDTFELVQREISRRAGKKGKYYDSPFTLKVICGDCGAYYGHRVWHSNTRYRRNIWLCNDKYAHGTPCRPPRVTDDELKQGFLIAVNRLIGDDKTKHIDAFIDELIPLAGDIHPMIAKKESLENEVHDLRLRLESLIRDNATRLRNQKGYTRKFNELTRILEGKEAEIAALEEQISTLRIQKQNMILFLEGLQNDGEVITSFSTHTWHALVDYAKVMADRTIEFHWRNGNSTTVSMDEIKRRL